MAHWSYPFQEMSALKLYYSPGACSTASHIVLEESGLPYQAVRVDLKDKVTADGTDYNTVNPKGYVPAVQLDDGQVICENTALLPYLGELNPKSGLLPAAGSMDNYRVREWTGYISIELHKNLSPLFRPNTPEATVQAQHQVLKRRFGYVNDKLGQGPYLTGNAFTVADAYLFVVLSWFPRLKMDRSEYPNLQAFYDRVRARPAVQKVATQQGLTF
jgi:glutathione S-transferase